MMSPTLRNFLSNLMAMRFSFIPPMPDVERTQRKIRYFKMVVGIQVFLLLVAVLSEQVLELLGLPHATKIAETLFFLGVGIYVVALWDMLRVYTQSRTLIVSLFVFIMGVFLIAFVTVNPFFRPFNPETTRQLSLVVMASLFGIEVFAIVFTTLEMIKREMPISEKLWGSACIYLIIGIAFGGLYEIITVIDYTHFNLGPPIGASHFMNSIFYSFLILGGLDNPFYDAPNLVVRLSAIEAVWGNLFVVFVIGRIMYR